MHAERYSGQSVLVTGAQGFVGAWLAERLLDAGARVVVPQRDVPSDSRFLTAGSRGGATSLRLTSPTTTQSCGCSTSTKPWWSCHPH